ncbi:MAG: EAL domain-containing protein [Alphaproteobacteria bacterium]|nr:EAL domain-containing protein [Alphaproteobacteria bacterium]
MNNKIRLQPLFDLNGQDIIGYEVLYSKFEERVFPSAVSILEYISSGNEDNNSDFKYFINMTNEDAIDSSFASAFLNKLDKTSISRERIVLELNENTTIDLLSQTKQNLSTLCSNGVQVALDDFGTNFSTLEFMRKFPLDVIKIDKQFIQNAPNSKKDMSLLKFCVDVSHDIGCSVVAEGIETVEQMQCSIDAGADIGQGFIFSAPVFSEGCVNNPFIPLTEFFTYLSTLAIPQRSVA